MPAQAPKLPSIWNGGWASNRFELYGQPCAARDPDAVVARVDRRRAAPEIEIVMEHPAARAIVLPRHLAPVPEYDERRYAAYAEAGDFDKAVEWQKKGMDLAPADEKADYETRLKLYQDKKVENLL
jgi:hypothetical protein